ncbi:uncharacterized protein si:dkeyp-97a10.3 isoform X1 [Phyllopteryx taeniolatus]|uniref:uncharacterized protein si:dkeyp-97a10.3 isoform X1 n=1 Tax=Phyllopteryx taeniolatus TaxID=161469 RepID=UPI002AD4A773|nr:uncharacterized protein si:dkeyp-97a10.3 isoform X1 [Phyllopteryx taeniolatus]
MSLIAYQNAHEFNLPGSTLPTGRPNWRHDETTCGLRRRALTDSFCAGAGPNPDTVPDRPGACAERHRNPVHRNNRPRCAVYDVVVRGCHAGSVRRRLPRHQRGAAVSWPGHHHGNAAPHPKRPAGRRGEVHGGGGPARLHGPDVQLQISTSEGFWYSGVLPHSKKMHDAVSGVTLSVPSVATEGGNITLMCTSGGTALTFQWGKGGVTVTEDGRITIAGGSLVINPGQRADTGDYTCTVSNPVSALAATQSLTVFYGPDTPVLTKDAPKDCVGSADVQAGQILRLTCLSDSLPPALFTWQRDGETVASAQPDSGVLSVQTSSTDDSGRYTCTARNAVTSGTSERATDVSVENTCLDAGEVAGIVIGSFLLLVILVLLIVLLVCLVLRRRARQRQGEAVVVQKNHTNPRPLPPDQRVNIARNPGQGPDPPVFQSNTQARRPPGLYATQRQRPGYLQALQLSNLQQNGTAPELRGDVRHNASSYPLNGVDNPAFTRADTQQINPNIVIQTGAAQNSQRPAGVQLSLTQGSQHNAQMPTIHVNLNTFPQQETINNATQLIDTGQSNPQMQSGSAHQGPAESLQTQPGLIPTRYTHSHASQRNAKTQTYQQESLRTSSHRHMPWDRLRGTPAYPSGTLPRGLTSDTTDYTNHPPLRQNQTQPRGRNAFREDTAAAGPGDRTRSHSADFWDLRTLRVPQLEPADHSHRKPPTQRERARLDSRVPPGIQPVSSQDTTQSTNPFVSQQAAFRQSDLFSSDTRALADPNHLLQAQVAQQQKAALAQAQSQAAQTRSPGRPRQAAPVSNQRQPSALTQAALKSHTESAQTFQNPRQQTQAALLHPGSQAQPTSATGGPRPPTPPPVIPFTRFQSLPRTDTHHKSHQHRPGNVGHNHQPPKVAALARGHAAHARHGRTTHGRAGHATHPRQAHRGRPR